MGLTPPPALRIGALSIRGLGDREARLLVRSLERELMRESPGTGSLDGASRGQVRVPAGAPETLGRTIAAALRRRATPGAKT